MLNKYNNHFMLRTRMKRIYNHILLTILLAALCLPVWAQAINPMADDVRLKVNTFTLVELDSEVSAKLPRQPLLKQLALERARFGEMMSVDELHQVADALTAYVRAKGYVFHSVFLPPQKIEDGFVTLNLQKGTLSSVHIINNTALPDARFSRVFKDLVGNILYAPAIEDRVQALKMQGGFEIFAFYSRGVKAGEARLNLKVEKSRQRSFSLKADNYGSESSGKQRLIAQYSEFQLTGHHDRLSLAVLRSVDDVANTYGSLSYSLPFAGLQYAWDISASNNQFEVGARFASLGLEGDATTVRTGITKHFGFHAKHRSRMRLGLFSKHNSLGADDDSGVQEELSQGLSLQWFKDKQWQKSSALMNWVVGLSHGEYSVEAAADGQFNKLNISTFWLKGMASGHARNVLQLNLRGQASDAGLPSVEGVSLTGADGVRGYEAGGFNADNAVLASLEWRFPSLLYFSTEQRWRLEPFVMGDWATGDKEGLGDGLETQATYASAGVGMRLDWGRHLTAQVTASSALKGELNGTEVEGDGQVLFEIRWY